MLHSVIETIPAIQGMIQGLADSKEKSWLFLFFFITKSILYLIFFPQKQLQNMEQCCKKPFYLSGEQDVHWQWE